MDIKSINRPKQSLAAAVAVLLLTCAGFLAVFPLIYGVFQSEHRDYFEREEFARELYEGSYALYYRLMQSRHRSGALTVETPVQVTTERAVSEAVPATEAEIVEDEALADDPMWPEEEIAVAAEDEAAYSGGYYVEHTVEYWQESELQPVDVFFPQPAAELRERWVVGGDSDAYYQLQQLTYATNEVMDNWCDRFENNWNNLEYLVLEDGAVTLGTGDDRLARLGYDDSAELRELLDGLYTYYAAITFGGDGEVAALEIHGASDQSLDMLTGSDPQRPFREALLNYMDDSLPYQSRTRMQGPSDMTVVFAVPNATRGYFHSAYSQRAYERRMLANSGLSVAYTVVFGIAAALALVMVWRDRKSPGVVAKLPLELAILAVVLPTAGMESLSARLLAVAKGEPVSGMGMVLASRLSASSSFVAGTVFSYLQLLAMLAAVYAGVYAMGQVFVLGPGRYLARHSITGRVIAAIGRGFRRLWRWLTDFDLSDPSDKAIFKVLGVNFALVALFCSLWVFGILGLVVYTLLLLYFVRKYVRALKGQYTAVLRATGEMARGNLDVAIESDLGVFEPLADELRQVQEGFRQAVEAEVRSRSMKTELVTNVSHDLKTPLTAIITYVGLLKDEDTTEEDRRAYVETLELKSRRLQRLIEDLFEMSKATTGNVVMNRSMVDLSALVKQVELELRDEIEHSGVEFRHHYPQERLPVNLDGERTCRIFENLLLNVTKYAMPGTRAYIDVGSRDGMAVVEIKNVSREALDFNVGDLTERFVRGDRSRNTDGSGLGLAIARSFTELQDGTLDIRADGDLFKATVTFPLGAELPPATESLLLEGAAAPESKPLVN